MIEHAYLVLFRGIVRGRGVAIPFLVFVDDVFYLVQRPVDKARMDWPTTGTSRIAMCLCRNTGPTSTVWSG